MDRVTIEVSRAGAEAIKDGLRFAEVGDRQEAWSAVQSALLGRPMVTVALTPKPMSHGLRLVSHACPVHGEIGQKVLQITGLDRSGTWCGECLAEALGKAGVQRANRKGG